MNNLYDITISKLDQKAEIGPNWNGWNVQVQCRVHTDTFTDIEIHTDYVMEVNEALSDMPYADKMTYSAIDLDAGLVNVKYSFELSADMFRSDLIENTDITGDMVPEGSV